MKLIDNVCCVNSNECVLSITDLNEKGIQDSIKSKGRGF